MEFTPSYEGIGSANKVILRTTPHKQESKVTTQRPSVTTPSPRGYA